MCVCSFGCAGISCMWYESAYVYAHKSYGHLKKIYIKRDTRQEHRHEDPHQLFFLSPLFSFLEAAPQGAERTRWWDERNKNVQQYIKSRKKGKKRSEEAHSSIMGALRGIRARERESERIQAALCKSQASIMFSVGCTLLQYNFLHLTAELNREMSQLFTISRLSSYWTLCA